MSLHSLDLNGLAGLVGAVGTAVGGVIVSASGLIGKRNATRKRELRECEQGKDELEHEILLLEMWAFQLCKSMAEHGVPPIPRPVIEPKPIDGES